MVKVAVDEYEPVLIWGLSTRDQMAVPESPTSAEWASAPKPTTLVPDDVLAGVLLTQGVPELGAVQVYARSATAGPPALKVVTCTVMDPDPPPSVVRILYVKLVVPP
jgi:hypothetical protein